MLAADERYERKVRWWFRKRVIAIGVFLTCLYILPINGLTSLLGVGSLFYLVASAFEIVFGALDHAVHEVKTPQR